MQETERRVEEVQDERGEASGGFTQRLKDTFSLSGKNTCGEGWREYFNFFLRAEL